MLDAGQHGGAQFVARLGTRLTLGSLPGKPRLTVVGIASSITDSAAGWVIPGALAALRTPGSPASTQMLYRFRSAGSAAVLRRDAAAVAGSLPRGVVVGTESYLRSRRKRPAKSLRSRRS